MTKPLLRLFDYQELPRVDQIVSLYLRLDDAHRSQFMDSTAPAIAGL